MPTSRPAVFFDRDGIINVPPPPEEYYVLSPERFFLMPGFVEALRVTRERGYAAIVVTNQYGIGKGLLSEKGLAAIHAKMNDELGDAGLSVDAVYHCPHGGDHPWRKPNPGMLLQAASDHALDLSVSWMVGDSPRDIEAGQRAGCAGTIFVGTDPGASTPTRRLESVEDLAATLRDILYL